MHGETLKFETR